MNLASLLDKKAIYKINIFLYISENLKMKKILITLKCIKYTGITLIKSVQDISESCKTSLRVIKEDFSREIYLVYGPEGSILLRCQVSSNLSRHWNKIPIKVLMDPYNG